MKLRGAGWLIGSAVTITAFGMVAACDDDADSPEIALDGGTVTLPDGGGTATDGAITKTDGNIITPTDSGGTDSNAPDATLPAQCNDGKVDLGETCDPLDKCPTDCPPDGCNVRTLENGGTCAAVCTVVAVQTQCQNGDGCCPTASGCSISNDNDCGALCGNGVTETGETCDGTNCPTDCPPVGCQLRTLENPGTCLAKCVDASKITTCGAVADGGAASDNCCPALCDGTNDPDCAAGACGNSTVDPGETCDTGIPDNCPTKCANQACKIFALDSGGTCQAACKDTGKTIDVCINDDGCCDPSHCNATNDSDCKPVCGNKVKEAGEECDGDCPDDCKPNGCQLFTLQGKASDCTAKCVSGGTQTTCVNDDMCCPATTAACTFANDNDCPPPTCGNGKLDPGETCDDKDPAHPCPTCDTSKTCVGSTGSAAKCDLKCNVATVVCSARKLDLCCPFSKKDGSACGSASDGDCNGASWKATEVKDPIAIKDGACVVITIENVEAGGAYDVTTCSPAATAVGDVTIKSVVGTVKGSPSINYGGNEDCLDEKVALPYRAGYTCNNKDGKPTMACVAEGPGGFFAKNASDLHVTLCAANGDAAVPFTVFYNAVSVPIITVAKQ